MDYVKDEHKQNYFQTMQETILKIEAVESARLQKKDENYKLSEQKRLQNVITSLWDSLKVVVDIPVPVDKPQTQEELLTKINFLKEQLYSKRSIKIVYEIGELFDKLRKSLPSKKEFYLITKRKTGWTKAYIAFIIELFNFVSHYSRILYTTFTIYQFKKDFKTIKGAFALMDENTKQQWKVAAV
jgi:hypothetical protein